jgi:hypothetical protein
MTHFWGIGFFRPFHAAPHPYDFAMDWPYVNDELLVIVSHSAALSHLSSFVGIFRH